MTTNVSTTINVYFDPNHNVQYSPNNQIQVPNDSVETVVWKGLAPLQFKSTGSSVTNLSNITPDKIVFTPGTNLAGNSDTITMTINNAGGASNVSATVKLGIVDSTSTAQPPVVIDGGGSIRNKGTSIWVWELVAIFAAITIGILYARLKGTNPQFATIAAVGAAVVCFVAAWISIRALM